MNREGKRYISYKRVSTEMQVDGFSLEGQNNLIIRFGEREEMVCVGEYEDAGKSGKSIEGRPDFKRMLADIEGGLEVDYVLGYTRIKTRKKITQETEGKHYPQNPV